LGDSRVKQLKCPSSDMIEKYQCKPEQFPKFGDAKKKNKLVCGKNGRDGPPGNINKKGRKNGYFVF